MDGKRCHRVQQVTIANNQEDYSSYPSHPVYNLSSDLRGQRDHSPFVIHDMQPVEKRDGKRTDRYRVPSVVSHREGSSPRIEN